ncbi:Amino acid transporter AVT6B [Picochlorum sp. SENEW3]|nr:Amino acid transporter AVT6B [Picochlorum sp. SENEW3]
MVNIPIGGGGGGEEDDKEVPHVVSSGRHVDSLLAEPLLAGAEIPFHEEQEGEEEYTSSSGIDELKSPHDGHSTAVQAVSNLVLTSVGAGMLSLPKAYATIGLVPGVMISLFAGVCTFVCCKTIVVNCAVHSKDSYGGVVGHLFGGIGYTALQGSIILHVFGVMVVYMVILGDILVGDGSSGIIPYVMGYTDVSRTLVVGILIVTIIMPMLIPRRLDRVGTFSRASVYLILYVTATLTVLCLVALVQGVSGIPSVALWPPGGSPLSVMESCLTSFSVTALAFTCHFNLVAVHNSLRDSRVGVMKGVVKQSTFLVTVLYTVVALAGYVLFGERVQGDVLKDLTIRFTGMLVGETAAMWIISVSLVSYALALQVNYVLKVWAVRNAVVEVVWGRNEYELTLPAYYGLTVILVAASYVVSIFIPSIFTLAALIGSTACAIFSYFFPGLMMMYSCKKSIREVLMGVFAILLSFTMAIFGTMHAIRGMRNPDSDPDGGSNVLGLLF